MQSSGEQNYWQQPQGTQEPASPTPPTPASSPPPPPSVSATPSPAPQPPAVPSPPDNVEAPINIDPSQIVPSVTPAEVSDTPEEVMPAPELAPIDIPLPFTWEARELVHHNKGPLWFLVFGVAVIGFLALSILVLHDWFLTVIFAVLAGAIVVVARRPPRIFHYAIDEAGVKVNERVFSYDQFQSFSVAQLEPGEQWNIIFMPTGRFKPSLILYFDEKEGETIVDALGNFLPMEEHKPDIMDRLAAKLRF